MLTCERHSQPLRRIHKKCLLPVLQWVWTVKKNNKLVFISCHPKERVVYIALQAKILKSKQEEGRLVFCSPVLHRIKGSLWERAQC